jgi:hypothetical protein
MLKYTKLAMLLIVEISQLVWLIDYMYISLCGPADIVSFAVTSTCVGTQRSKYSFMYT